MKLLEEAYEDVLLEKQLTVLDFYGDMEIQNGMKQYANTCPNRAVISEASLSRALSTINNKNLSFAIISAYRKEFSRINGVYTHKLNILRNRKLRSFLNQNRLGVQNLVGHWQECQIVKDGTPVAYNECPKDQLVDVIERSYFVAKPSLMDQTEFENILVTGMTVDGVTQDGVLIREPNGEYVIMDSQKNKFKIGDKMTLGKIAQAYSQAT